MKIQMVVFDIDGVLTDGKKYVDGTGTEWKSLNMKDLDALGTLKSKGYILGCISGEDNLFSRKAVPEGVLDFTVLGCKSKETILNEKIKEYNLAMEVVCYIGDGKYDIPALKMAGIAVCPKDAIGEVKKISHIVLKNKGGEGCIAELCDILLQGQENTSFCPQTGYEAKALLRKRMEEHKKVLEDTLGQEEVMGNFQQAVDIILHCYHAGRQLFLCGNGGSAADAQHLAAELVGRFYLERRALGAEALTTNSSVLTALTNDYSYDLVFSRQLEAKARRGDVLVGISTSGASVNVLEAFKKAREIGVETILMTGRVKVPLEILSYTDCLLEIPSGDTPRIQEIHILLGHVLCECVEAQMQGL